MKPETLGAVDFRVLAIHARVLAFSLRDAVSYLMDHEERIKRIERALGLTTDLQNEKADGGCQR